MAAICFYFFTGRPNASFDCWPLTSHHREQVIKNIVLLVAKLDPNDLFIELRTRGVINDLHMEAADCSRNSEKNEELVDILLKRSIKDYYIFMKCLDETGQRHLKHMFLDVADNSSYHVETRELLTLKLVVNVKQC